MRLGFLEVVKRLPGLLLLLLMLITQASAQVPVATASSTATPEPTPRAVVTLTGGPNPSPAVVGNKVRCRWQSRVDGPATPRNECLAKKVGTTWYVDSLTWIPEGAAPVAQPTGNVVLTPSGNTLLTEWTADKAGTWIIVVRAEISYSGTECGGAWSGRATGNASVSVQNFVLHPSPADFSLLQDGAARVLISKTRSDPYYSINRTTRANTVAQNSDGQITATAHLPPAGNGTTIHFRVIDPDDASPYEPDVFGGDNHGTHSLSAASAVASLIRINDNDVAAAEVVLDFSASAGDNYILEASGDPAFPANATQRTPILVAWKRTYLEIDDMYERGATITVEAPVSMGSRTTLNVDNTEHFVVGTNVVIFTREPFMVPGTGTLSSTATRQVLAVTPTSVEVDRIGVIIPQWSGVKLVTDGNGYSASHHLIETAYGAQSNGSDGGAFIEFKRPIQGGRMVPHHSGFATEAIWENYSRYWFANSSTAANNTFQLLTARQITDDPSTYGITSEPSNISTAFIRGPAVVFTPTTQAETVVHELGHQFSLIQGTNGHVDSEVNAPNILPPSDPGHDQCIMSYNNTVGAGHVKFDIDCYHTLRRDSDPR